jgi:acylphosphatase
MADPGSSGAIVRCARFVVQGHVQGVFFRAATREMARSLNLNGWVRNCADGSVELVACGSVAQLDALEAWLGDGPPKARVNRVLREHSPIAKYPDFLVRR